ncbi:hypothetical protein PHYPSEUDO_008359 [Phytophthora pseudosyringae]|uniref:FYVE zinc finger domain-containing protein n=1 Tax=Phytophthora pseudosyringae TaxID=221518 RepID=A0A8T1WAD8_9STRA|nr:hypothetical protein PHYPSEUDO_008359 [Phytophthora pseudosyringae]
MVIVLADSSGPSSFVELTRAGPAQLGLRHSKRRHDRGIIGRAPFYQLYRFYSETEGRRYCTTQIRSTRDFYFGIKWLAEYTRDVCFDEKVGYTVNSKARRLASLVQLPNSRDHDSETLVDSQNIAKQAPALQKNWIHDERRTCCTICTRKFQKTYQRRHHCWISGDIVCKTCYDTRSMRASET